MQGPRLGDVIWCRIHAKQNCAAGYFLHNVLVSFGLSSRIDQFKTCGFLVVSFLPPTSYKSMAVVELHLKTAFN